jgi:mitotic spindle assembly checkpoint protein MAD2
MAEKDKPKLHKLSIKGSPEKKLFAWGPASWYSIGSSKLVAEFFEYSINTILFQRGVYPAEDFNAVKKYGLNMLVSSDDQVKAYIKKIMSQLNKWMVNGKISKLVVVITDKDTGEHLERWQFEVSWYQSYWNRLAYPSGSNIWKSWQDEVFKQRRGQRECSSRVRSNEIDTWNRADSESRDIEATPEKTEKQIQDEIQSIFRQITASVTFLPMLDGNCTFNVLVYADADSEVPTEWGESDSKEIKDGEKVQLRSFSTSNHRVDTLVSYR